MTNRPFFPLSRPVAVFALMVLVCGSAAVAVPEATPGGLRSATTLHSVGIEWDLTGDDDYDAEASVRYRPDGASSWNQAMPLIRVEYAGQNMLAGSILFLDPATNYEVEIDLSDPDGGAETRTITVTTRSVPRLPTGGRTLHVVPGSGGGDGSEQNPYQGMETAWADAQPGDVFLLHAGSYGGVRDAGGNSGTPDRPVVWKPYGDGEVLFEFIELYNASYQWFEGLTFRVGSSDTGLFSCLTNEGYDQGFQPMARDIDGIVLIRNRFEGYKHAVRLGPRTSGWYITDNVIIGNKTLGMSGTESFDGEGIELAHGNDHVVAYNDITLVADGVSFPNRNCDIFGNDIYDVTDDGIELDGGRANTRAWGNRIHNPGHNGIAFQPQSGAPWYIVRNQVVNFQESAFKFRTTDRFVAAHNTFVNWGDVLNHWAEHLLRGVTKNNLWISVNNGKIWRRAYESRDWRTDLDYDGFDWGSNTGPFMYEGQTHPDLPSLTAASGLEAHGITVDQDTCFETFDVPGPPPLTTIPPQWMTLNPDCEAVDAGVVLPNLSDGFTGTAPDMGAYERGLPLPHYGPRPVDDTPPSVPQALTATTVSETQIDLAWQPSSDAESGVTHYRVYRDGAAVGDTSSTTYEDTGLSAGTTYSYEVSAFNGAGLESGRSEAATATTATPAAPDAPANLRVKTD
jgi:hypothetical protein